jgi:glycosyltransferase involved in cell wall biosynthesis
VRRRILFVVNAEWYFSSHRLPLALALRDRGDDVTIAAGEERGGGAAIAREGLEFIALRLRRRSLNPFRELASFFELLRLYRRRRPDLVHHVTIKPVLYGSLAARLAGVPAVVNAIPGLGSAFTRSSLARGLLRRAIESGYRAAFAGSRTRVILQNPDDRRYFVERGFVDEARTEIIRGAGVNIQVFSPHPEPPGLPVVLLASRLLWEKGVGDLVDASKRLRALDVACRVVLVGAPDPGSRGSLSVETLRRWQEDGLIEWWGPREDMPDVLARSAIVVLPSTYPEGVPKSLLEGAAAGRPLVATDMPGCREIVRPGVNGILVPPHDPAALARAIEVLLRDPELRRQMGARGRQIAVEEFSEARVVQETLALYDRMLGEESPVLGGGRT